MIDYLAKRGSRLTDEDATVIGRFLEQQTGGDLAIVTPEEVVRAARPTSSPIHPFFEWRDDVAAHEHRLSRARHLTRSIMVVERGRNEEPIVTRAFHFVRAVQGDTLVEGYAAERVVWERQEYADQVIERAKREFLSWRARYRQYQDLEDWVREQLATPV